MACPASVPGTPTASPSPPDLPLPRKGLIDMTFSVMWTTLPRGYAEPGTATLQLSMVATPRVTDARITLGNSALLSWPTFSADLPALFVQTKGSTELIPATRTGPAPDLDLWRTIFTGDTKVQTRGLAEQPPQIVA